MDKLLKINWFGSSEINSNQIFSMIALVFIVLILSVLIYVAVKRQKANKAPNAAILLVETAVIGGDNFFSETHESKFDKANPYLISLFVFIFFGNILSLIGFAPIGTSLSAILAATVVTWLGTAGVGIAYNKIKYVIKLLNPLEFASNYSPIISMTFRVYGNIIGGVVLFFLTSIFLNNIWAKIIGVEITSAASTFNPFGVLVLPAFNLYFDLFGGAIQGFVFVVLTISYWSQAAEVNIKEKHKKKIRDWKKKIIENKHNSQDINA
ncbi:F0F1 ATP synthase subunit A [Metamycoplasma phocicerebrale]|uniref:F0F1 ATP synthase subunit A n=1 Tax=Metamycoplasma phocicerebrale TaxID=142649 RepID=A0A3T0TUA2_9BACT|nr:F0F1 ATP synthase subunit A [Metamycoplasma phocicerebrale]AZZ65620.1 F0F1 ATP synthase subunit A [Metamycoplasma phocicerebrale]